jgi:hypothetical protein
MEGLGLNFYMGTQNGSKVEILGILIHALELKLRHFEVSPYGSCIYAMFAHKKLWARRVR